MDVPFFRHDIGDAEIARMVTTLHSEYLTTAGVTREFEDQFAAYLGSRHCIAISNATTALFLSLKALGIGPGDEVIVPAMTFIATANVVEHCGATPVFADADPETALLDVADLRRRITDRTKAMIPVHLYGQMADMVALSEIASSTGIHLVEDAAHCIEGQRNGLRPGANSDLACFSFYATKNITCGEGGAIVTNDGDLAEQIRLLRLHGMARPAAPPGSSFNHWDMTLLGYKANLPDVLSALLISQLERIEANLLRRIEISRRYQQLLSPAGVGFPKAVPNSRSAWHLFVIFVPAERREQVLVGLQQRGVGVGVHYRPVHLCKYYKDKYGFTPGSYPAAEQIGAQTISLPFYPSLKNDECEYVARSVIESLTEA